MSTTAPQITTPCQPEDIYWHFLQENRCLSHGDGRQVVVGETLAIEGEIGTYKRGLHAAKDALNAMNHVTGSIICIVKLGGTIIHNESGISVASERTPLWVYDAEKLLFEFACNCAEIALLAEREAGREPHACNFAAIEVTRRWIKGEATDEERSAACKSSHKAVSSIACSEAPLAAYWTAYYSAGNTAYMKAYWVSGSARQNQAHWAEHREKYSAEYKAARHEQSVLLTNMLWAKYADDRIRYTFAAH